MSKEVLKNAADSLRTLSFILTRNTNSIGPSRMLSDTLSNMEIAHVSQTILNVSDILDELSKQLDDSCYYVTVQEYIDLYTKENLTIEELDAALHHVIEVDCADIEERIQNGTVWFSDYAKATRIMNKLAALQFLIRDCKHEKEGVM